MPAKIPPKAIGRIPLETYATVDFVGQNTNPLAKGPVVELDDNTWMEAGTWTFEEVSETKDRVELFDASRGTTMIIDYTTNLISITDSSGYHLYDYDVTGVSYALKPEVSDGWMF